MKEYPTTSKNTTVANTLQFRLESACAYLYSLRTNIVLINSPIIALEMIKKKSDEVDTWKNQFASIEKNTKEQHYYDLLIKFIKSINVLITLSSNPKSFKPRRKNKTPNKLLASLHHK